MWELPGKTELAIPPMKSVKEMSEKTTQSGTLDYISSDGILIARWKDNSIVTILSTDGCRFAERGQRAVVPSVESRQDATTLYMTKHVTMRHTCKFCSTAGHIHRSRWMYKTAAFVLINTEEYHEKLDHILTDTSKLERLSRNPTENIKREANSIIQTINAATNAVHLPPISGDFGLGYLYGNVKTHKQGNPLRPIISQCPAPTYQLAKRLNTLLTPYIPNKYCVTSSAEFMGKLRNYTSDGVIASMDVESLFTNVPLNETINFIMDRVYRDTTTPTLNILEAFLRALLEICTKKTPFTTHKGHIYIQKDGVAMGSPLGVLFANFYMGVVEERVFRKISKPDLYVRCIDDTFIKTANQESIEKLRRIFEECSSLRFTLEHSLQGRLPFLDVLLEISNNSFNTSVYVKPTNLGLCLNGDSECPSRYKTTTIRAFIRGAISHCSSWRGTHEELDRITKILMNNSFMNKDINRQIKKEIEKWYQNEGPDDTNMPA
ncbi:uncharacterized protein [Palaemon carinicauda]|uniref:uncharacterized protein n=1 Tax=Palaemon carinicauda TaxID=392227 RepID=UPI0035B5F3B5